MSHFTGSSVNDTVDTNCHSLFPGKQTRKFTQWSGSSGRKGKTLAKPFVQSPLIGRLLKSTGGFLVSGYPDQVFYLRIILRLCGGLIEGAMMGPQSWMGGYFVSCLFLSEFNF